MDLNNALNLQTRRDIYNCILKYPGIHLRQIFREIKCSQGSVRYNVKYLKKCKLVLEKTDVGYSRYYAYGKITKEDIQIMKFLRKETSRNILLYIFCSIGASQIELSKELNKDAKTINFHINKLIEEEIIEPANIENGIFVINYKEKKVFKRYRHGREIIYQIKDPYLLYNLLIKYFNNLHEDNIIKSAIDFSEFFFYNKSKLITAGEDKIDKILDTFSEIFPFPYTL